MFSTRNFLALLATSLIIGIFFLVEKFVDEHVAYVELTFGIIIVIAWYLSTSSVSPLHIDSARFVAGSRRKRSRSDRDAHYKRFCYRAMYGSPDEIAGMAACGYPVYPLSHSGLWYDTAKPGDVAIFTCYKSDSVTIMVGKTVHHQRWNVSTTNTSETLQFEPIPEVTIPSAPEHETYQATEGVNNTLTLFQTITLCFSALSAAYGWWQVLETVYTVCLGTPAIAVVCLLIRNRVARCKTALAGYGRQARGMLAKQAKTAMVESLDMAPKMITGTVVLCVLGVMSMTYRIYHNFKEKKESKKKRPTLDKLHNILDSVLLVITMAKLAGGVERNASNVWRRGKFYLAMLSTAIRATKMFAYDQDDDIRPGFMNFVKETSLEASAVASNVEDLDSLSAALEVDEEKHDLPGCDCNMSFGQKCHCDIKEDNEQNWSGIRKEFDRIEAKTKDDHGYLSTCRLFVKEHPELILVSAVVLIVALKITIRNVKTTSVPLDIVTRVDKVRARKVVYELRKKKGAPRAKRGAKRTNAKTAWVMYDKDGTMVGSIDAGDERRNMAIQKWIADGAGRITYDDLTSDDHDIEDVDYTLAKNNPLLSFFEDDEGNTAPLPPQSRPRKPKKENAVKKHKKALNRERRAAQKRKDTPEVSLKAPSFSVQAARSLMTVTNNSTSECMNAIKLCNKLVTMKHLFASATELEVSSDDFDSFVLPSDGWYDVGNDMVAHDCPPELRNMPSAKVARDFQEGEDVCVMAINVGGTGHLTTSCGKVTSILSLKRGEEKAYGSASTVRGNCGAPWLNKHGHVIGLHSTGSASGNGFIPITQIVKSRIAKNEDSAMPDFR